MAIRIERHRPTHADGVRAFNARLVAHDAVPGFLIDELPPPARGASAPIVKDSFLALDGTDVRGGFELHRQAFWVGGRRRQASNYRAPLSEGIVDRRYAYLGMLMVKEALRDDPFVYCVGMGGMDQAHPRLISAMHWGVYTVPFLFRIERPARVLRQLPIARASRRRALAADVLAASGLGWLGTRLLAAAAMLRSLPRRHAVTIEPVTVWGAWADELWESARDGCSLAAVRDAATLTAMYPPSNPRNICVRMSVHGLPVGWAALYDTTMRDNLHFGRLRVGSILDCWARPGFALTVAGAAAATLRRRRVDLVVVNHAHAAWIAAFRRAGFLTGPSNYGLGLSPSLAAAVRAEPDGEARMHVTRGDGDGRVHL